MVALLVGLAFGFALTIGAVGWARHSDAEATPVPLGTAALLAGFVVLVGNGAALLGYSPAMAWISGTVLLTAGWVWGGTNLRKLGTLIVYRPRLTPLLALTALALAEPLLILPVPLDTDAQGFGYLSLMIREGGRINSLTPWHPEIAFLYSPGALLVFATLSSVFTTAPMSAVMMGATHAVTFLFVWLAWEFGHELGDRVVTKPGSNPTDFRSGSERWAGAMAVSAALSVGLWTALLDSHYTAVFALFFLLAFLTSLFRFLRTRSRRDIMLAVLILAAIPLTHPDTTIILILGLASFAVLAWLAVDRPAVKQWLQMSIGIPAAAAILISPWLISILALVRSGIESPFQAWSADWRVPILYHGLIWPCLALLGAGIYLRSRQTWVLLMVGWLIATLDLSMVGLSGHTFPAVMMPLLRFNYPFSLAWHAPIIPYMALSAGALVWLTDKTGLRYIEILALPAMMVAAVLLLLAMIFSNKLLMLSKGRLELYGAFATSNDVRAMRWLHDHTPLDARILNYPGDYEHLRDWEAHWAPVLSERDCVYFRMQPFFQDTTDNGNGGNGGAYAEQKAMLSFWRDPGDAANAARLHEAHIDYVLLPESVGDPESLAHSWRWQPPALLPGAPSIPKDATYLRLVFQIGGAQIYQVQP